MIRPVRKRTDTSQFRSFFDQTELEPSVINGSLVRGARGLLGWSVETLARRADVGTATILRIEHAGNNLCGQYSTIDKIERALIEGGVQFTEGPGGEFGVRFGTSGHTDKMEGIGKQTS
jgi:ribosome-binding protein aMBF1 (putative translation factor)